MIETIVIIFCVAVVVGTISSYIYKRVKGVPSGGCSHCNHLTGKKLVERYHKKYKKTK